MPWLEKFPAEGNRKHLSGKGNVLRNWEPARGPRPFVVVLSQVGKVRHPREVPSQVGKSAVQSRHRPKLGRSGP